VTAPPG